MRRADDPRTICSALRPQPGDRILCTAGPGDTPLSLLVFDPAEIIAVDPALPNLHLARLKAAAVTCLSLVDLHLFLGARLGRREPGRLEIYHRMRHLLDPVTRTYWDDRPRLIRRGVLPGRDGATLPYLLPRHHPAIAARGDRIRWVHATLGETLRADALGFDCLSLSGVTEGMSRDQLDALLVAIAIGTRPHGRILIWSRRRGRLRTFRPLPRTLAPMPALQHRIRRESCRRGVTVLRRRG